jgi:hypothetical protein
VGVAQRRAAADEKAATSGHPAAKPQLNPDPPVNPYVKLGLAFVLGVMLAQRVTKIVPLPQI